MNVEVISVPKLIILDSRVGLSECRGDFCTKVCNDLVVEELNFRVFM